MLSLAHLALGLPSTQTTTLQPAYLPTRITSLAAASSLPLLTRTSDQEADAGTANLSVAFLGAVEAAACQPVTITNDSTT
jgi:hypothetical protein